MTKYLKIQSKGEIEIAALSLMGASTKRNDSALIGQYGSGGKYSISALLRNKIGFKIYSGEKQVCITTKEASLRGSDFSQILINDEPTSLTTSMGGDEWDEPFAPIREIYSNALDEDQDVKLEVVEKTIGKDGYTTFYIEMTPKVEDFYENLFDYFCAKNPAVIFSNEHLSAYPNPKGKLKLFRKGILCKEDNEEKALYQYNSEKFRINESRVLSDTWDAKYEIAKGWKQCENEEAISDFINHIEGSNAGTYEHGLIWNNLIEFSKAWFNVLQDSTIVSVEHREMFESEDLTHCILLPFDIVRMLKQKFPKLKVLGMTSKKNDIMYSQIKNPSPILENKVIEAVGALLKTNYKHRWDNPAIKYVKFSDSQVLGQAEEGEILLSGKLDSYSTDEISKIIIEENEHNKTGYGDKTRNFQNHFINLYFESLKINS